MQQANRTRVQPTTTTLHVIPAQTVLVPSVLDGRHMSSEHQQKRRQRTQLVDPITLLNLHPSLDFSRVPLLPPLHQIHHHHPRVEVTRPPLRERPRQTRLRPEPRREVLREVSVAVLRRADGAWAQTRAPKLGHVVHHHQIGVQVDNSLHATLEKVREVVPGVIERLLQRLAHGGGDQVGDGVRIEVIDVELQVGEGGLHQGLKISVGDEKMEEDVLRTEGVAEDGVHGGDRTAEIFDVESYGDVD